jgi:hypothetical protein
MPSASRLKGWWWSISGSAVAQRALPFFHDHLVSGPLFRFPTPLPAALCVVNPLASVQLHPAELPPCGDRDRWAFLLRLRGAPALAVEPWLQAIESGALTPTAERQSLLLVVHGRAGGELPAELASLAAELERRRGAPVRLQALTAARPPAAEGLLVPGLPITLVPLLLLPGDHVRHDIPAIAAHWRRHTTVRRLPFLGAWPSWQRALVLELQAMGAHGRPLLLHHPLAHPVAGRYLAHLERVCAARALATPYSADELQEGSLLSPASALPLTLAANRLTERLGHRVGPPLLQRPALRAALLDALEALP